MKTDTKVTNEIQAPTYRELFKLMGLDTTDYTTEIRKIDVAKFYRTVGNDLTHPRVFANIIGVDESNTNIIISESDDEYTAGGDTYNSLNADSIDNGSLKEFNIYDNATVVRLSNTESKVYKEVRKRFTDDLPPENIWIVLWKSESSAKYFVTDFILQSLESSGAVSYHMSSMCNVYENLGLEHIRCEML